MQLPGSLKETMQKVNIRLPGKINPAGSSCVRDTEFLRDILPFGLEIHSLYYKAGERYVTILIAYSYPSYLGDLLFADLFNRRGKTVIMDVTKKPKKDAVDDVEKSINELSNRGIINRNTSDDLNDSYEIRDLNKLHASLQRTREDIAYITLRFLVSGDSLDALNDNVSKLRDELSVCGIKTVVPENEMISEFIGLQDSADTIRQPIPVIGTLQRQFPFYFQEHTDKNGLIFGQTPTGGLAVIDSFSLEDDRKCFDVIVTGKKGAGKTALLCSMMQDTLSMGNKVMAIDVEGELHGFADKLGGRVIRPTDDKSRINVLQLHPMFSAKYEDDTEKSTDEKSIIAANYTAEISRVMCFFYQMVPSMTDIQAETLSDLLQTTYRGKEITEQTKLDGLSPGAFPVMSDLLATIRDALYVTDNNKLNYRASLSSQKRGTLESLEAFVKPLAEGIYSSIFNGISTVNISSEDLVIFDVSVLSEMEDKVYNAQLMNILAIMWGEIYRNRVMNEGVPEDRKRYCISVIDEAHRIVNTRNAKGLEFIDKLLRRDRKYLGALWFASQSPRDFAPSGATEQLDKINNIFALVQYKILMQQDDSNYDILEKLFTDFTKSEIESTSYFGKGDMFMSMGSGHKIRCNRYIPKGDFEYFGGGR